MIKKSRNRNYSIVALAMTSLIAVGCGGGSSSTTDQTTSETPVAKSFQITVVNATNNQPLSPIAVISHSANYSAWSVGSSASTGLEYIAEDGSNSQLFAAISNLDVATASSAGPVFPGNNGSISITASADTQTHITVATMLINTNDAFAGLNAIDVSGLASGESMTLSAKVYDAGTELNSESAGTMPGPADGGEGFNAARSDIKDVVRGHGGVVTLSDGLAISVLNQTHRFDNPGMIVTIMRN